MRKRLIKYSTGLTVPFFFVFPIQLFIPSIIPDHQRLYAQAAPTQEFDQAAELAKLRGAILGKEKEPASAVFKNIRLLKSVPAGNLLAIMEFGFSRSLGVNCTQCHIPAKWESDEKTQKQTARDMWAMVQQLNNETLKGIKTIKNPTPTVNCTTCHRGESKPATNLPPKK